MAASQHRGLHMNKITGINAALSSPVVGGSQSKLAGLLGIKPQAVQRWVRKGQIPLSRTPDVARATGISMEALNPEFFSNAA
mgnify:CR=1 FL=1